jgi:cob(I)alamin adenosyltransferase
MSDTKAPYIYTKTGDAGTTSLLGGRRVPKYHHRIELYGSVDELSSLVGVSRATAEACASEKIVWVDDRLREVQENLMVLLSRFAAEDPELPGLPAFEEDAIPALEADRARMNAEMPLLTLFIRPSGSLRGAQLHYCRTVCRRAERRGGGLAEEGLVDKLCLRYMNRLSDWLFTTARYVNYACGIIDEKRRPTLPADEQ